MALNKVAIASLIPHAGTMCLLDEVVTWDNTHIHCRTRSHQDPAQPLRRHGRLPALALIEYGAQAMAVHGGLLARAAGIATVTGLLVSARNVCFEVDTLEGIDAALEIHAERLLESGAGWLYEFQVIALQQKIAAGRVAVIAPRDGILAPHESAQ